MGKVLNIALLLSAGVICFIVGGMAFNIGFCKGVGQDVIGGLYTPVLDNAPEELISASDGHWSFPVDKYEPTFNPMYYHEQYGVSW